MRYLCINYHHWKKKSKASRHDALGKSWIHRAAVCGKILDLQNAINEKIDVTKADCNGLTPLHYAVHAPNSWEVVRLLLNGYSDTKYDAPDRYGMTPLAYMILFNKVAAAAELLYRGASLQHPIATGITIPGIAHHFENKECLDLIKQCKEKTRHGLFFKNRIIELQDILESAEINNVPGDLIGLILSMLPCDARATYKPQNQTNTATLQQESSVPHQA